MPSDAQPIRITSPISTLLSANLPQPLKSQLGLQTRGRTEVTVADRVFCNMAGSTLIFLIVILWSMFAFNLSVDPEFQEQLFLKTLGLSSRPKPSVHGAIPALLWKMFKKSHAREKSVTTNDPCMVSEFGVRGNIVRYVQDQGK